MPDDCDIARPFAVELTINCPRWREAAPDIEERAREAVEAALAALCKDFPAGDLVTLSVVLADDRFVHDLNLRHRGKDKPTNVLSFPAPGSLPCDMPERPLGDIVLAYETMAAEARMGDLPLLDHTSHLLVHGVLHLLGYTHDAEPEAEIMERREKEILGVLKSRAPGVNEWNSAKP